MGAPYKVKITVVKKTFHSDLVEQYSDCAENWRETSTGNNPNCCHAFDIGHEFISDGTHMPENFPDAPWVDIQKYPHTRLLQYWMKYFHSFALQLFLE